MDVAADFTTGIWVVAVEVATVGVGLAGGIGFMRRVGLAGIGWAITLTLYLIFTGALALLFFSTFLGTKVFPCQGISIMGRSARVWLQMGLGLGLGLGPSFPSSSRYVFIFLIKDG